MPVHKCHDALVPNTFVEAHNQARVQRWMWRTAIIMRRKNRKWNLCVCVLDWYKECNHAWKALILTEKQRPCPFHGTTLGFVWLLCCVKEAQVELLSSTFTSGDPWLSACCFQMQLTCETTAQPSETCIFWHYLSNKSKCKTKSLFHSAVPNYNDYCVVYYLTSEGELSTLEA